MSQCGIIGIDQSQLSPAGEKYHLVPSNFVNDKIFVDEILIPFAGRFRSNIHCPWAGMYAALGHAKYHALSGSK
jgi:hypothetical protein